MLSPAMTTPKPGSAFGPRRPDTTPAASEPPSPPTRAPGDPQGPAAARPGEAHRSSVSPRVSRITRTWGAGVSTVAGAAVIVACLLGVGVAVVTRGRPAEGPAVPRVDVVGDSLVNQARGAIQHDLEAAGYQALVVGLPAQSLASQSVRGKLDDAARAHGDVLVLATTANDVRANAAVDGRRPAAPAYRDDITALLDRFSDRCVVVVNARDRVNPVYLPERAAVLNNELGLLAQQQPNLVVVDWASRSHDLPPSAFSADQLHFGDPIEAEQPGSASARAYADAIADGVRQCRSRS
jgi:hypothetical protein